MSMFLIQDTMDLDYVFNQFKGDQIIATKVSLVDPQGNMSCVLLPKDEHCIAYFAQGI